MFLGGWAMMVAVGMLPGTLPLVRLVGSLRGPDHALLFLSCYTAVWLALGAAGYAAFSPLASAVRWAGTGAILAATAVYELSPAKDACLRRCRSPLRVVTGPTLVGAFRHSLDCAGCCAFLMALMVALGLMGLVWAALLGLVVLLQKATPFGARSPRVLALGLAAGAVVAWL
jgi:predicted metal-binding membrane protein